MTALEKTVLTPRGYLEEERKAEFKSEYIDGEVFAMVGATYEHNIIAGNVFGEIGSSLKERPCTVFTSDMKVWLDVADTFNYPDVSGLCGPIDFYDDRKDVYENPHFIIEVLSDSTETYDRGDKFFRYQTLSSLKEYVLISQKRIAVEVYRKQGKNWLYHLSTDLESTLDLQTVECSISLTEIYRGIEFQEGS